VWVSYLLSEGVGVLLVLLLVLATCSRKVWVSYLFSKVWVSYLLSEGVGVLLVLLLVLEGVGVLLVPKVWVSYLFSTCSLALLPILLQDQPNDW
jgi:hypothetical protein